MKRIILAMCLLFANSVYANADVTSNNQMIKECLNAYGYDYTAPADKRLNNFDWQNASNCVSNFVVEEQQKKVAEQKEFLKKKPWFKGPNFKWEERAEYTCSKVYSAQHGVNITLCQKPYYLN